jgi:hemolysin activation/secretion protein
VDAGAPVFAVERFDFIYGGASVDAARPDALDDPAPLKEITVPLTLSAGVYHAPSASLSPSSAAAGTAGVPGTPGADVTGAQIRLGDAFPGGRFAESALVAIFQAIATHYNKQGVFGVFVVVDRDDIDPQTREDYRPAGRTELRLVIWISRVSEVRSVAKGARVPPAQSVGHRVHHNIRSHSPLLAGENNTPGSPLYKTRLDNYLLDLNRHPARRVDAAISAGPTPGEVTLDYLVAERRPWFAYAQFSNSGSESTDDFREHLGFAYYQLTNRDDTLLLDFSTASFKGGFSTAASYDYPILYPSTLRAKIYGSYSEFVAEDPRINLDKFSGHSISAGLELAWSPFHFWGFSVDFAPGFIWQTHYVNNTSIALTADTGFTAGQFAVRLDRNTEHMRTALRLIYETNFAGDTNLTPFGQAALGREDTKPGYQVFQYDLSHSMFMEPLLFGEKFYTGENWRKSARAHEISLTVRGQQIVNNERVIPQKMMTIGGMYSLRGYPDSVAAGDNVIMGALEYRLHVPRLFRPLSELARDRGDDRLPPFRLLNYLEMHWRAPGLHSLPDWDFVIRLFADTGRVKTIRRMSWERDLALSSIGIGFETQFFGHLNIRGDWGFVMNPISTADRDITRGSSQFHFSASLIW